MGLLKSVFITNLVLFLGYVVSKDGIAMDESKVEAIKQWAHPNIYLIFAVFMR